MIRFHILSRPRPPAPIQVGDVVRLQGGWVGMLVVDVDPDKGIAVCAWRPARLAQPCEALFEFDILEVLERSKERR